MMPLRPYQNLAVESVYDKWHEFKRVLVVMPTGVGKTICFAHIAAKESAAGRRTLILAHRDELIRQAVDKLHRATGVMATVEKAEETSLGTLGNVVVGSVQTLMRQSRLDRFAPNHFQAIVVDECHHALSDSYQRVLSYFADHRVCGVTATPDRGDKKNLGQYFEELAYEYGLRDAIRDGWLCRIAALTIPLKIDLSSVRITAGDYNEADLGNALDPYLPHIADAIPADRKTLVFTPLCATAQKLQGFLNAIGRQAFYASGEDRGAMADWEAAGPGSVMLNAMLLNEGYDHPPIDCICVLRCTRSRPFFAQMCGRGTRIHPGKRNLLLLDFLWNTSTHDLCHPCNLVAGTPELADKMEKAQEEAQVEMDLDDLEKQAQSDVIREREEALAEKLRSQRNKKRRAIDPVEFGISIAAEDLVDYEPMFAWEKKQPTDGQLQTLAKFGLAVEDIPSRGYASKILERVIARSRHHMASPGQVALLRRFGYTDAGQMNFKEAKKTIDGIAANGWRRPEPAEIVF